MLEKEIVEEKHKFSNLVLFSNENLTDNRFFNPIKAESKKLNDDRKLLRNGREVLRLEKEDLRKDHWVETAAGRY